jgi:hypothetical protein
LRSSRPLVVAQKIVLRVVVVVDTRLPGIKLRRWDPFDATVCPYSSDPAGLFDEAIMGRTSEDFFVDIGIATARPASLGVMDLAAIAGHCATGEGAAAVARMQDDALAA